MKRNTFTQYILLYPGQSFLFCLLLRYLFVLLVPITNDEAYYWTWGKSLQLSYVDHPPGVALLAYFEGFLPLWDISSRLALRWLIPILHGISSYLLFSLAKYFPSEQQAKYKIRTFILTQFIPGFSFLGAFLLPDIGLLFALSCALSLVSKIYFDKIFSFARALSLGFFLGLSLLFKYHGFPLSGGLLLGLFFFCRKEQKIIPFLILTFLMMCLTFSPVLFWNYQHHWISFLFQTKHGFESPHFNLLFFARFILGCCLFVTPLVFYNFLRAPLVLLRQKNLTSFEKTILFMTLPLFTLFCVNSFFKQMLPHWILPCLWPMVLILRKRSLKDIAFLKETFFVLYLVILGAIFSLNIEPVSSYLASHSTEMKEWFLWEKVSAALQAKDYFKAEKIEKEHCPKNPVAIAFNWFRAAQLSVHLPQNVSVYCLDFFKPNFYYFRDMNRFDSLNGCFVTIFGYKDDFINMEPYFKETNSYPFDEVPSINDPLWVKQGMLNGLDSNKSFKF